MFSVAFFSLASLALSALASPLASNIAPSKVPDAVRSLAHVRRYGTVDHVTVFVTEFEVPLVNLGA